MNPQPPSPAPPPEGHLSATPIQRIIAPGEQVKGPEWDKEEILPGFASLTVGLGGNPLGTNPLGPILAAVTGKMKTEGQKLIELDSSGLQESLKTENIEV